MSKTGTNQLHGSAFEFLRNSALDARNFFGSSTPPLQRNEFGGVLGGPIKKDKTFFFGEYAGFRQLAGEPKKKVLSFLIGPPNTPPNSNSIRGGGRAKSASRPGRCLLENSKALPCNWLVPVLLTICVIVPRLSTYWVIYTYAIGRVKGMEDFPWLEVWDVDRITLHRNRNNRVGDDHYSYKHWEMYARKIPLLQVIKYLPSSIELATTLDLDASAAEGKQALTIEGVFAQSPDSEGKRVEKELEAEGLMEKLGWDDGKRKSVRESYLSHSGGLDELLGYLGKQSAPLSNGQGQSQQQTQQQSTEGTGKQTTRRGKQHTDSKTEPPQDQAGQRTEQQPSDPAPSTQTQKGTANMEQGRVVTGGCRSLQQRGHGAPWKKF